jgi:hypothetical protein
MLWVVLARRAVQVTCRQPTADMYVHAGPLRELANAGRVRLPPDQQWNKPFFALGALPGRGPRHWFAGPRLVVLLASNPAGVNGRPELQRSSASIGECCDTMIAGNGERVHDAMPSSSERLR